MNIKKLFDIKAGNMKKFILNMVIAALAGVLLMLIGDITSDIGKGKNIDGSVKTNAEVQSVPAAGSYVSSEESVKKELEDVLSMIEGAGKVKVLIYFESGKEVLPAFTVNDTVRKTEEKDKDGITRIVNENTKNETPVILSDSSGSKALIIKEKNPKVGGVVVIAQGAGSPQIRDKLRTTVKVLLGIPESKVAVVQMKK